MIATPGTQAWFDQQEEIAAREERIAENNRIFAQRVREANKIAADFVRQQKNEATELMLSELDRLKTEYEAKKLAKHQRQNANRAARAAESQRIRNLRSTMSGKKDKMSGKKGK